MSDAVFITRVVLRNYKSIAVCDVRLRPLTFLVGPNGSGKSNFLDALRFVADSLRTTLDQALRERNGIQDVRRRSGGHPNHFAIRVDFVLPNGGSGHYAFSIGALPNGGYQVQNEECFVLNSGTLGARETYFRVANECVDTNASAQWPPAGDRLYLVLASSLPEFRPVYERLSRLGFYNLNPQEIRELQPPDAGELLRRDGSNLASVLARLTKRAPETKARIEEYLRKVVPGVHGVDAKELGPKETLDFRQGVQGAQHPWHFLAANMSDGTLRALGVLVSLFQTGTNGEYRVPLVGIEEPEVALHPGAAGVLLDSLRDASERTQVIVTSHSPDVLDSKEIDADEILAVDATDGVTHIAGLDGISKGMLRDRLYTAGELLRTGDLRPDPEEVKRVSARQLRLFDIDAPCAPPVE